MPDWRNNKIRRLTQQVEMLQKDFMQWMRGEISDKEYSFRMSNHLFAFSEILKDSEE